MSQFLPPDPNDPASQQVPVLPQQPPQFGSAGTPPNRSGKLVRLPWIVGILLTSLAGGAVYAASPQLRQAVENAPAPAHPEATSAASTAPSMSQVPAPAVSVPGATPGSTATATPTSSTAATSTAASGPAATPGGGAGVSEGRKVPAPLAKVPPRATKAPANGPARPATPVSPKPKVPAKPAVPARPATPAKPAVPAVPKAPAPARPAAYFANCAAARAAGAAPIRAGQPGYRPGLDRDKDGIACDK